MTESGRRKGRSRNRPTDGVGDSGGWDWEEDGQQVLSPFISGLHPSYGARCDVSQNSCPDYGSRESGRAEGERERVGRLDGAQHMFHITPHFPASSAFSSLFIWLPSLTRGGAIRLHKNYMV